MKSLSALSILLFLTPVFLIPMIALPQGTWERITVPTIQNLHAVSFADSLFGWAVGDSGTILHTEDGGLTWSLQNSPAGNDIMDVFFLDRFHGWACAYNFIDPPFGSILLKTTDGGSVWVSSVYPEENIFINCIHYFDSLTGWMGGTPHALVKTTDGGVTWNQASIDTSTLAFFPVLSLSFYNQDIGYATGGIFDIAGVIWRTTNGGDLWYAIDPSQAPADEVHGIHIFDEQRAIGSGGDPDYGYGVGMIRTSDGGLTWNYGDIGIQGIAFDIEFRTASQAWSPLGPQQKLIFSPDSGTSWIEIPTPGFTSVFDISFTDSLHGFGVGSAGAVIRFIPPVQPIVSPHPAGEEEFRVFPNPTMGSTKYEVRITKAGLVQIVICNPDGKVMKTVVNRRLVPGDHSFCFDTETLPAGIYVCLLKIEGVVKDIERIVVIHYVQD